MKALSLLLNPNRLLFNSHGLAAFAISNIVSVMVPMHAFLNGSMVSSTQKYQVSETDKGNQESLKVNLTANQRIKILFL